MSSNSIDKMNEESTSVSLDISVDERASNSTPLNIDSPTRAAGKAATGSDNGSDTTSPNAHLSRIPSHGVAGQAAPGGGVIGGPVSYVAGLTSSSRGTFVDPTRFKTRICRNHNPQNGSPCPFGDRCCFAHGSTDVRPADSTKTFTRRDSDDNNSNTSPVQQHQNNFYPNNSGRVPPVAHAHHQRATHNGGYINNNQRRHNNNPYALSSPLTAAAPAPSFINRSGSLNSIDAAPLSPPLGASAAPRSNVATTSSDGTTAAVAGGSGSEPNSAANTPSKRRYIWDPYQTTSARVNICRA